MVSTLPKFIGIAVGLALAYAVMLYVSPRQPAASGFGPMLSECDGQLRTLVIHYTRGSDFVLPVYRDFLRQLDNGVRVIAVCPDREAYEELCAGLGKTERARLEPLIVGHEMTTWSRDRWVALAPAAKGLIAGIVHPRREDGADIWAARAGDQRIADDLARAMSGSFAARTSEFAFDGGDLIADAEMVFVTPEVIARNLKRTAVSAEEIRGELARLLGKRVVMLREAPPHHAGMFMMLLGQRRALVGDPSLGRAHWSASCPELPDGPDFSAETQRLYDAVAGQLKEEGYAVVRIPIIPAVDGKTYLTHVNVLIDRRDGASIVYMPIYRGAEGLNDAAGLVWRGMGYEVRPVDCTTTYRRFGNLHCLVNVLERGEGKS